MNGRRSVSELFQKTRDLVKDGNEDELGGSDDSRHRRRRPTLEVGRDEFPDGSDLTLLAEETNSDEVSEEDSDGFPDDEDLVSRLGIPDEGDDVREEMRQDLGVVSLDVGRSERAEERRVDVDDGVPRLPRGSLSVEGSR